MEEYHSVLLAEHKKIFEKNIREFVEDEKIPLLNYKGENCPQISRNHYFFYDAAHMSYCGATAFTTILNKDIS